MLLQSLRVLYFTPVGLEESRSTRKHWCGRPECLGGVRVASGPIYILLMDLYLGYSRELVEISHGVIIATRTHIQ
jgi:hypothetical protein